MTEQALNLRGPIVDRIYSLHADEGFDEFLERHDARWDDDAIEFQREETLCLFLLKYARSTDFKHETPGTTLAPAPAADDPEFLAFMERARERDKKTPVGRYLVKHGRG